MANEVTFDVMVQHTRAFAANTAQIAARQLYQEAEAIMADSKKNYVPVKTGNLRSTGHVQFPSVTGGKVRISLVYGGPAAPYALRQHEIPYHHAIGQWKYLETPLMNAISGGIGDRLKKAIVGSYGK